MFSEKLKTLRKQAKMTQEEFAQELHVSRQAVTKWETNVGVPDISNLKAISNLFHISIDELLENENSERTSREFLHESVTEYDIDRKKRYDISLISSKKVVLSGYTKEKVKVRLASNEIMGLESLCKVKIDDVKQVIDIDLKFLDTMSATAAKESLYVFIEIPEHYAKNIELSDQSEHLVIQNIEVEDIEFNGKVKLVELHNVTAHVELNTNTDMDIYCDTFLGQLDMNQVSATSTLHIPMDMEICTLKKGIANKILYQKDGSLIEDFSRTEEGAKTCDALIEFNGMKSELTISKESGDEQKQLCKE